MNEKPARRPGPGNVATRSVEAKRRRALARLGLASMSAYTAPTLLALRSAMRSSDVPGRITHAA